MHRPDIWRWLDRPLTALAGGLLFAALVFLALYGLAVYTVRP